MQHTENIPLGTAGEQNKSVTAVLESHREVPLFGPGSMDIHTDRSLMAAMEIGLYALFFSFITVMMLLPNHPEGIRDMFPNIRLTDPIGFILWVKITLILASLVPLFWGLHQSSKRLKGRLIRFKS